MGTHSKPGFTIIETMLVLAITGVLIATLLFGVGSSVTTQRYSDSVTSFRSLLQDQYSQVSNVSNDRGSGWTCGDDGKATPVQSGTSTPGQSHCVLLGRYVSIVAGDVSIATVIGYPTSLAPAVASDMQTIKDNYALGISKSSVETKTLEWGAQIAWPKSGGGFQSPTTPRSIAILFLRSPDSGTTYTFTSNDVTAVDAFSESTLKDMMQETTTGFPGQGSRTICIEPGAQVPEKFAVYITPYANGPGSIETRTYATTVALGGDSKC